LVAPPVAGDNQRLDARTAHCGEDGIVIGGGFDDLEALAGGGGQSTPRKSTTSAASAALVCKP
jgi:hypothetical protein